MFERGGKREIRMEAADHNIRASRGDYADIQRQQKVALYSAYYDLVAAQERQRISTETAGLFQKTIDAVERRSRRRYLGLRRGAYPCRRVTRTE
jgi:cobalt-zinc-cadmium efflux system outer membrane protein